MHDLGLFELDVTGSGSTAQGDANVANNAPPGEDWVNVFAGNDTADVSAFVPDGHDPQDVSYFTGGGTKDERDIGDNAQCNTGDQGWQHTASDQAPDKDEILDAFSALYQFTGSGPDNNHFFIYFGADRFDNSGDSQLGFWFFKNEITEQNPGGNGDFTGCHAIGDILVLAHFVNGGRIGSANVYSWQGGQNPLKLEFSPTQADCSVAGANDNFCAVINNTAGENPPWDFLNKSNSAAYGVAELFEGGVDITQILGANVGCFNSFLVETRSSASTTAQLKDYALGQFPTCSADTTTTANPNGGNVNPGTSVTDSAKVVGSNLLGGTAPTPAGTIQFVLCQPSAVTADGCPVGSGDPIGSPVTLTAPGPTCGATPSCASAVSPATTNTTAIGKYCWRAEYTPAADSPYASDTFTNATDECFTTVAQPVTLTTRQFVFPQDTVKIVAPAVGGNLLGNVTFKLYDSLADCNNDTDVKVTDTQSVGGATTVVKKTSQTSYRIDSTNMAGTHYWKVSYDSDNPAQTDFAGTCTENTLVTLANEDTTITIP